MGSDEGEAQALEEARSGGAALLGVELHAGERAALGDRDDAFGTRGRVRRLGRERVREVERAPETVDAGPADARDASFAQAHRAAGHDAEPLDAAVLLGLVERELETEADAEDRTVVGDAHAQRLVEAAPAKSVHRRAGRADSRQDGEIRAGDVVREARTEPRERDLDRTCVAGAVVADRDSHTTPFVEGMPSLSRLAATRSARPTALNAASATWCSSRPTDSTWIAIRAACAMLDSTWPASPGSSSSFSSAAGRPPRSTAARASASSIGTTASPKRAMPRRSPSARSRASPSARAASSAVWCSPVSRSPAASRTRSKPAWKASCSRKWS